MLESGLKLGKAQVIPTPITHQIGGQQGEYTKNLVNIVTSFTVRSSLSSLLTTTKIIVGDLLEKEEGEEEEDEDEDNEESEDKMPELAISFVGKSRKIEFLPPLRDFKLPNLKRAVRLILNMVYSKSIAILLILDAYIANHRMFL